MTGKATTKNKSPKTAPTILAFCEPACFFGSRVGSPGSSVGGIEGGVGDIGGEVGGSAGGIGGIEGETGGFGGTVGCSSEEGFPPRSLVVGG